MSLLAPLMDDEIWSVDILMKNLACYTCNNEFYNDWQVCLRRSPMVNLHPEFTSRDRQCWFVALNTAKYFVCPDNYTGPVYIFHGLLTAQQRPMTLSNSTLPAKQRRSTLFSYGKILF